MWAKLDDRFPDHPKVVRAGGDAAWLYVCALCYAASQYTDGFIPIAMIGRLSDRDGARKLAAVLVDVGLWDQVDGGYQIHDYLEWNPSADDIRRRRVEKSEAGKAGAEKRWRKDDTTHGTGHGSSDGTSHGTSDDVGMSKIMPPSPSPSPSPSPTSTSTSTKQPPPPVESPRRARSESRRKPKLPFPDNFEVSEADRRVAHELGFGDDRVQLELAKCRSHFVADDKRKADWHAAFQNWLRRANEFAPSSRGTDRLRQQPAPNGQYRWDEDEGEGS